MASHGGFLMSTNRASEFHQNCVPKEVKAQHQAQQQAAPAGGKHSEGDHGKCDAVTQDTIWKQVVNNEKSGVKGWEQNWGFMTEYDDKGNPKAIEELPEKVSTYSDNVPNTNGANYGSRLNTPMAQTMQDLEFKFNSHNRKKKLGNEMICY